MDEKKREKAELEEIEKLKRMNQRRTRHRSRDHHRRTVMKSSNKKKSKKVKFANHDESTSPDEDLHDLGERTIDFLAQKEKKILSLKKSRKQKLEEEELKECTFQPRINKRSKKKKRNFNDLLKWQQESRTKQSEIKCEKIKKEATFKPHIDEKSKEIFHTQIQKSRDKKQVSRVEFRLLTKAKNKEEKLKKLRNQKLKGYFHPDTKSTKAVMKHKFRNTKSRYLKEKRRQKRPKARTVSPMVRKGRKNFRKREPEKDTSPNYRSRREDYKEKKLMEEAKLKQAQLSKSEINIPKKKKQARRNRRNVSNNQRNPKLKNKSIPQNYLSNLSSYNKRNRSNEPEDENNHWRPSPSRKQEELEELKLMPKTESEERIEKAKNALKELNDMLGEELGVLGECDTNARLEESEGGGKKMFHMKIERCGVKKFAGLKNAIGRGRSKGKRGRRENHEKQFNNFKGLKDKVNLLFNRDKIR